MVNTRRTDKASDIVGFVSQFRYAKGVRRGAVSAAIAPLLIDEHVGVESLMFPDDVCPFEVYSQSFPPRVLVAPLQGGRVTFD